MPKFVSRTQHYWDRDEAVALQKQIDSVMANKTPAPQPASLDADWQPFDGRFREGMEYGSRCGEQGFFFAADDNDPNGDPPIKLTHGSLGHVWVFRDGRVFTYKEHRSDITHQRAAPAPQPAPQGEASGTPTCERFTIRWVNEGTYCGYKVNIPNYEGGEVVTVECFERTVAELRAEVERLNADCDKLVSDRNEIIRRLLVAEKKASTSLANNLCPDHRDKQAGKACLACEVDRLNADCERLKSQLRIEYTKNDALARIRDVAARIAQVFGDDVGFVMPVDGELGCVQFVLNRYKEIKASVEKYEADAKEAT